LSQKHLTFTPGGIGLIGTMAGINAQNGWTSAAFAYIDTPSVAGAVTSFVERRMR